MFHANEDIQWCAQELIPRPCLLDEEYIVSLDFSQNGVIHPVTTEPAGVRHCNIEPTGSEATIWYQRGLVIAMCRGDSRDAQPLGNITAKISFLKDL